ncbi:MAG TPA: acyl-CoA dehydrogenase family protein, partial [Longimicrobium sp.]
MENPRLWNHAVEYLAYTHSSPMIAEPRPELRPLLERISAFVRDELAPLETRLLREPFRALLPAVREARERVKAQGMWAPHLPRELGGLGLPLVDFAHVSEALGRSPLGHLCFNCQAPDVGNMELLYGHGSDEQQRRWLRPLAAGEVRSCFSMTEPDRPGS